MPRAAMKDVVAIAAGGSFAVAVTTAGKVTVCGTELFGRTIVPANLS